MLNRPTTWAAKLCHIPGNEIFVKFQWRSSLLNQKQSSIRKKSFIPHLPFSAFAVWMVNTKSGDATTILKQEDQFLHVKDGDAKDKEPEVSGRGSDVLCSLCRGLPLALCTAQMVGPYADTLPGFPIVNVIEPPHQN